MSRRIWRAGPGGREEELEAAITLSKLGASLEDFCRQPLLKSGTPGLLDAARAHWEANGCNLSLAMNSITDKGVLESLFYFHPDSLQILIDTEKAQPEDVEIKILPEEGGFDLWVRHGDVFWDKGKQLGVQRHAHRNYKITRPLYWERAEYSLRDGVLQVVVPGPLLCIQPLPFPSPM